MYIIKLIGNIFTKIQIHLLFIKSADQEIERNCLFSS